MRRVTRAATAKPQVSSRRPARRIATFRSRRPEPMRTPPHWRPSQRCCRCPLAGSARHRRAGTTNGGWPRRHPTRQPRWLKRYGSHKGVRHVATADQQEAPVGTGRGARRGRDVMSPLGPIGGARTLVRMIGRAAHGAGIRSGADGGASRDGAAAPGRRRLRPGSRCAAAGPGATRTHGAPGAARARLRGHEVKLVLPRANPKCPRPDSRRDHLHAVRNLGGAARRPARRRG